MPDCSTDRQPACSRHIPLEGVQNFRDMGGYDAVDGRKVGWGRLFRSGHLHDMTEACGTEMVARNIETVVDFRSPAEKEVRPVHWPSSWQPDYKGVAIGGNAAAWIRELFDRLADAPFPAEELKQQFIQAFRTIPIANADGLKTLFDVLVDNTHGNATLFHCTAGKDRTGIAGILILKALGTPADQIAEDFLLTNRAVDIAQKSAEAADYISVRAGRRVAPGDVLPLVGVEADFMVAALASIEEHFGSVEVYLRDAMGLSPSRLEALRDRYLSS